MASFINCENKPLRKSRIGPPDVYPQDPKQKEDELTFLSVKQGFNIPPATSDEYGSSKNYNISSSKVMEYFVSALSKKYEINTLPDTGKKRQQVLHKDNYWPAPTRPKAAEIWLKDLVSNRPLTMLAKKVPIFNKREEILTKLCDYSVPTLRACWFIKMSSVYYAAISENKNKSKRLVPDQCQEWSQTVQRFLREQLNRLEEYYSWIPQSSSYATLPGGYTEEQKVAARQWQYATQLASVMYEEGLLDCEMFLDWIMETFRSRAYDDGILKLIVPLLLQYAHEYSNSEMLSRKLAYYVCKKLNSIIAEAESLDNHLSSSAGSQSAGQDGVSSGLMNHQPLNSDPLSTAFSRLVQCGFTRDLVYGLSSVLQVLVIRCPTALVWNNLNDGRPSPLVNSPLTGSPLDLLPCSPSQLPLPESSTNAEWRRQLLDMEADIVDRSRACESRWSVKTTAELNIECVLSVLDALDQHKWNRVDDTNNLDVLYSRVFQSQVRADSHGAQEYAAMSDVASGDVIIQLLCEWAVSSERLGEHRSLVVALLLEKRQSELHAAAASAISDAGDGDDRDSLCSGGAGGAYLFQEVLFKFLDTSAPLYDASSVSSSTSSSTSSANSAGTVGSQTASSNSLAQTASSDRQMFSNLVLLFLELTRHDVFSHDQYLRALISRGELCTNPASAAQSATGFRSFESFQNPLSHHQHQQALTDDSRLDIDDDLDKLVQHIKSTNADMNNPDSPKESSTFPMAESTACSSDRADSRRQNRHLIYTTHFPLPQDDAYTDDDKQRHILLFGVKKARDDARHMVKKMNKEIMKLFSKKFSIDVAEGGKVKRQCRGEFPFEAVVGRFQALPFYDQHLVTHQCAMQVLEILSLFTSGTASYLPVVEHVSFLFDLMELSMNIQDLLELCLQLLRELPEVDSQLHSKNSPRAGTYSTSLALHVVGAFRRYHSSLILSQEQTVAIFEGLYKVVKHVRNHTDCSSAERCVLAYLVNLYSCCQYLRSKYYETRFESFANAYPKLKLMFNTSLKPSSASFARSASFMAEYLANPNRTLEPSVVRALNESAANRYSLVCNIVIEVCLTSDSERLGDLAVLAAEATARCIALSPEWLSVLDAMCSGSDDWPDVVAAVDVTSTACHGNVALLMTVLAARHCIYMDDVIKFGAHCLMITCSTADRRRGPGARLVLRLLGHLWISSDHPQPTWYELNSGGSGTTLHATAAAAGQPCCLKYSCDRHLLLAAQDNILVPALLCALKAIIILADATIGDTTGRVDTSKMASGELSISAILGTSDHQADSESTASAAVSSPNKAGLSEFARHMLRQICSQAWVREKVLSSPEEVVSMERVGAMDGDDDVDLLERVLTHKQARRLFHMIVHPDQHRLYVDDALDERQTCALILERVHHWSLRVALLDLRLLYRQSAKLSTDRHSNWLNTLARATVDVFQTPPAEFAASRSANAKGSATASGGGPTGSGSAGAIAALHDRWPNHLWLIPPLVAKLPLEAQCRILQACTQTLESASWMRKPSSGSSGASSGGSSSAATTAAAAAASVTHQPFRQLVLTCVRGQEEQREELVSSLQTQFQQLLCRESKDSDKDKEEKRKASENSKKDSSSFLADENKTGWNVYNALQLRFSLLGGVFDWIQHGNLTNSDAWIVLLVQLVTNGVVTLYNNSDMFCTLLDMIATLIHSAVVGDTQQERPEENKRHFYTLGKKLRKELGDRKGVSIHYIRHFLPIPKKTIEIINTELKSAPLPGFESFEKRRGLILVDKQKISPWDLLEGHRNPSPLSWSWFGAVKLERVPSKFDDLLRRLRFHQHHVLIKPDQYFLEPPSLPPEELVEHVPELKQKEEVKQPPEVTSCDSPRGAKRPRNAVRKKRNNRAASNAATVPAPRMATPPMQTMPPGMSYQTNTGAMYPTDQQQQQQQQQQQWAFTQPSHQQQQQRAQLGAVTASGGAYFTGQQMPQSAGPRYQPTGAMASSKQAITAMLRNRHPNAFMSSAAPQASYGASMPMTDKVRHQMMRDQMRVQQQQQQHVGAAGVYGAATGAAGQPAMAAQQMYGAQSAMAQGYGAPAASAGAYMQPQQQQNVMMAAPQGYAAAQPMMQSQQQSQMMMMRAQQQQQQQQQQQTGYMNQMRAASAVPAAGAYMQPPNVAVQSMAAATGGQYRAMQPRMRHPMMMQQQQQQQQQSTLMNQLRQPSQQQQQQQQQHNPYQFHHQG